MKKLVAVLLTVLLLASALVGCSTPAAEEAPPAATTEEAVTPAEPEEQYSVSLLLPGAINDAGFNQLAYEGLMAAKDKYNLEVAYTENIAPVDFETVMLDYADKGADLIIGNGFDFTDAMKIVAPTLPDVQFAIVNGDSPQEPNLAVYRFDTPQTGFIAGALAALVSEKGVVGMVAGASYPHVKDAVVAYEAGAKYINPDIKVLSGYTESWSDMAKGKEMAEAMVDQGADVLSGNANQVTLAVLGVAKDKGLRAIGYIDDQNSVAPEAVASSSIQSVADLMDRMVDEAIKGEMKPVLNIVGVKEGVVRMSPWYHEDWVGTEGVQKMEEIMAGLEDGSLREQGILPKSSYDK